MSSPVGTAGHLLHRTTAKTMEVLTSTGETTKAVLTAVSDHRWWKESLNYLRPLQVGRWPFILQVFLSTALFSLFCNKYVCFLSTDYYSFNYGLVPNINDQCQRWYPWGSRPERFLKNNQSEARLVQN